MWCVCVCSESMFLQLLGFCRFIGCGVFGLLPGHVDHVAAFVHQVVEHVGGCIPLCNSFCCVFGRLCGASEHTTRFAPAFGKGVATSSSSSSRMPCGRRTGQFGSMSPRHARRCSAWTKKADGRVHDVHGPHTHIPRRHRLRRAKVHRARLPMQFCMPSSGFRFIFALM